MANIKNLKPKTTLSTEEAKEMGRKGGKASVKARKERKALKEELLLLLSTPEIQTKMSTALIDRAMMLDPMGNKAFEVIRDTIGEKPVEKTDNTNVNLSYEEYIKQIEDKDEY